MSRSRKKSTARGVCICRPGTVKKWKKEYNRSMRRVAVDSELTPLKREHGDIWAGPLDGKMWDSTMEKKNLRK